jgi:phosphatidylserine/phosphatidylglycerophosphate/cardiolipin synthase-like enzyme
MSQRIIRREFDQSRAAVADLLQAILVSEMVTPGKRLLLVSPWVSDFPVIDNRSGFFSQLDPRWGASRIRLSSVLRSLMARGTVVYLALRPDQRENEFVERLEMAVQADGTEGRLIVRRSEKASVAHEKALVGDDWALHGSMNFTYSGVELNGELITYTTENETVSELATELYSMFWNA